MDTKKIINYCYTNSERKWKSATSLLKSGSYSDCLFFCHLTLEFYLKGKIAEKTEKMFPAIHDLEDLVRRAKLELPPELKQELTIINTFNIAGRYDDYKFAFYKRATASYTKKYYQITKQMLLWLKKQ